jgi:hypothetical protein
MMLDFPARGLSASSLLSAWEQGWQQSPTRQALALLSAAYPEVSPSRLAELSVGRRDACLLALREGTFGPHIKGEASCPKCAEQLEFAYETGDVRAEPSEPCDRREVLSVTAAGWEATFRLPTSLDLQKAQASEEKEFRRNLLRQCVTDIRRGAEQKEVDGIPDEVAIAIGVRMEQADPQADVKIILACPSCGHTWEMPFDIASFFWDEINARAYRILYEVHLLACAYGWSESEILAMSPWRRQAYLDLVNG